MSISQIIELLPEGVSLLLSYDSTRQQLPSWGAEVVRLHVERESATQPPTVEFLAGGRGVTPETAAMDALRDYLARTIPQVQA